MGYLDYRPTFDKGGYYLSDDRLPFDDHERMSERERERKERREELEKYYYYLLKRVKEDPLDDVLKEYNVDTREEAEELLLEDLRCELKAHDMNY